VTSDGFSTPSFNLKRGVLQGDPLSPSLFIIVLELLALSIRNQDQIKGIAVDGNEIKLVIFGRKNGFKPNLHGANMMQKRASSRANPQQTWQRPHLQPYLDIRVNMVANVAPAMFASGSLRRKHMFASYSRRQNLM